MNVKINIWRFVAESNSQSEQKLQESREDSEEFS